MKADDASREAAREARSRRGGRRFNRCAMVLPPASELVGRRVLDLECRGGLGAFKIAELTGEQGFVTGLDRSTAHIEKAAARAPEQHWAGPAWRDHLRFAVASPENLRAAGIEDASIDIAIINSVLNVQPDPLAVLREVARVLAPGGYLYLDAVLAVEPLPAAVAARFRGSANAFGGAPTGSQLISALRTAGFTRETFTSRRPLRPERDDEDPVLAPYAFESAVVQAWA